jgi:hypothetical protein
MTNKSSSGGGDNKMHQIVMALITTIAAPVVVFFVTNNIKNSTTQTQAPTPIVQVVTATQAAGQPANPPTVVAGTAIAQVTSTATNPSPAAEKPAAVPTAAGLTNPKGTIPAGTPVLVDGLLLTVSKEDVKVDGKTVRVSVKVKNTGTETYKLAFTPGSIGLKDDGGRSFEPLYGDKKSGCKKDDLGKPHTLEIKPGAQVTLSSVSADKVSGWCAANPGGALPLFSGEIGKNTKKLEVVINGVGPFRGFQLEVTL